MVLRKHILTRKAMCFLMDTIVCDRTVYSGGFTYQPAELTSSINCMIVRIESCCPELLMASIYAVRFW